MATKYADFMQLIQPAWTRALAGADALHAGKGDTKDSLVERIKDAVIARFPLRAPTDALQWIGAERGISRGAAETDASYALRLQHAWDVWPYAGTAFGVLSALHYAGYDAVLMQARKYAYSLDSSLNLVITPYPTATPYWTFDGSTTDWARFMVLLPYPLPTRWLAGGVTSVFHGGTGPTIMASGPPIADVRVLLWITTGGPRGTAQFMWSQDNGQTAAGPYTISNPAFLPSTFLAGNNITLTFPAGTYVVGDTYRVAPTFNVPADDSSEASLVKSIVNLWKPAHSTVSRYVIHTSGYVFGWPVDNKFGLPSTGGTLAGAPIHFGGSTSTVWSP
jgi:hypothetical protein